MNEWAKSKSRAVKSNREVAKYQAQLGDEAERQGDHKQATKWRNRSRQAWRDARNIEYQ